jgi:hypothetical protein
VSADRGGQFCCRNGVTITVARRARRRAVTTGLRASAPLSRDSVFAMVRVLVLMVAIVGLGCQGPAQEGATATPQAPAAAVGPAAPAQTEPAWWCIEADGGATKTCSHELSECHLFREHLAARGRPASECAGRDRAFCSSVATAAGTETLCAADIGACRNWRDVRFAKGASDTAVTECTERRGSVQQVAAPLDPSDSPWWCTENSVPPQTCARQIYLCQGNLKDFAQDGRMKRAKCVPRDHAHCFARQLREGVAGLECAPELFDCGRLRDVVIKDANYGLAKSDCAERR